MLSSPTEKALYQAHVERRLRIAANAVIDRPIDLKDRRKRPPAKRIEIREVLTDKSADLMQQLLSLEQQMVLAQAELERLRNPTIYPLLIHRIISLISAAENIPRKKLIGHRRFPEWVRARDIGYYLARNLSDYSYPQIGRYFGYRDHTTILHGYRKIEKLRLSDPVLDDKLKWYEAQLSGI